MSLYGIKIARVYEVQRSSSVPLDDSDYDIQESIWYKINLVKLTLTSGEIAQHCWTCLRGHQL